MKFAEWSKVVAGVGLGCCVSGASAQAGSLAAAAVAAPAPPSVQVQPALAPLKLAVDALNVDRWKASKAVRETTAANLNSIRKDLLETLPGLLATADAAPASVAAVLPVTRNLGALYDVALRVTVVAETAAPEDQVDAMQSALSSLEGAKRSLNERVQSGAEGEERQVTELTKKLNAPPVVVAATPPPVCPPPPAKKKKPAPKPAGAY